jgi:hypothetical protein
VPPLDAGLLQALEELIRGKELELNELSRQLEKLRETPGYGAEEYLALFQHWRVTKHLLQRSREDLELLKEG